MTNPITLSNLLFGPAGPLLLNSMLMVIIGMTLLVSARLLVSRRKIGYLSMMVALALLLAQHAELIHRTFSGELTVEREFFALLVKVTAFVMLNIGIYQLYNATRRREFLLFFTLLGITAAVSMTFWYAPVWLQGSQSEEQLKLLRPLGMELYLFLLIFLSFLLVHPRIGQTIKYQVMLTVYFAVHTLHMVNLYLFGDLQPVLQLMEQTAPFLFYMVLFLFIFERVIEIMQAIYHSSITDGLTKLYNRKYFLARVSQYVVHRVPVAVLFCDIDNFKQLNDTKGHSAGDEVLITVARILREETDALGLCGRYGGEEMAVLITDSAVDPAALAERIRARVQAETPVTLSMGLSRYAKGMTVEALMEQADEAMYRAKTSGKNKIISA